MSEKVRRAAADLALVVFAAATLSLGIPVFMISRAPRDYGYLDFDLIWSVGLVLTLVFAVVLIAAYCAVSVWKGAKTASAVVIFLVTWVCVSGLLIPISASAQLVDPVSIPTSIGHLIAVLALCAVAVGAATSKLRQAVVAFPIIVVVTAVLPNVGVLESVAGRDRAIEGISTLASQDNILVISFDGLPGGLTNRMILEDSRHRQRFKDFEIFDNAVATAGYTYGSLLGAVHGNKDFKSMGSEPKLLENNLDNSVLPMNQPGIEAFTYGDYNRFNLNDDSKVELLELAEGITQASRIDDVLQFYQYVLVRVGTRYAAKALAALGEPVIRSMEPSRPESEEISDLLLRLRNYDGPWWDRKYLATIQDFYGFLRRLQVGTAPRGLRYMHFAFTHFPVDFDEGCGYHGDEPQWYADSQNEAGAVRENECALRQFGALLDRLEEVGAYDGSLIVLLSDHGKPSDYYSTPPEDFLINGHKIFGFGRFRPFLAIKRPGGRAEQPRVVDELVLLDDLARTVCVAAGVNSNCQQFPGIDLLNDDLTSDQPYFLYVPDNERSTHVYDTHRQVVLSRSMRLLEAMRAAEGIEVTEAAP